jgi:hypothetical protein
MNLEKINLALLEVEEELRDPVQWDNAPPIYFVIGAPRSGTTLLTQLLAYCFDFGYITNVAARFWLNPVLGIQFSKEVLGDDVLPSFSSNYANTRNVSDIHEFGKFWMSHLGLSSSQDVDWMVPIAESASLTLQALRAIQSEFNKPIVMKGIYPAYCHEWLNREMGGLIRWVHIKRDPVDTCISILDARRKQLKDESEWFGWHIPRRDRDLIYSTEPYWQIAYQVRYFQNVYDRISGNGVWLRHLCDDPTLLEGIVGKKLQRYPPELACRDYSDRTQEQVWFNAILEAI